MLSSRFKRPSSRTGLLKLVQQRPSSAGRCQNSQLPAEFSTPRGRGELPMHTQPRVTPEKHAQRLRGDNFRVKLKVRELLEGPWTQQSSQLLPAEQNSWAWSSLQTWAGFWGFFFKATLTPPSLLLNKKLTFETSGLCKEDKAKEKFCKTGLEMLKAVPEPAGQGCFVRRKSSDWCCALH